MNIYEKLSAIQAELKAPKNQRNDFGKYNYRSCEDILEAVKPLCVKNKVTLVLSDTMRNIGDRYYVEAVAALYDMENPEDRVSVTSYAREEESKKGMDGSQITGASSSYARKYALNGLFNIDDTKDSDATNTGTPETKPVAKSNEKAPAKPAEQPAEKKHCEQCGKPIEDYLNADGKKVSAQRHIDGSVKKFGRVLCMDCITVNEISKLQDMKNGN